MPEKEVLLFSNSRGEVRGTDARTFQKILPNSLPTGPLDREGGDMVIPLDRLERNKKAKVIDIQGGGGVKRRLNHMGIHPGDSILMVRYGALKGPIIIEVHGFQLALGRGVASQIFVEEVVE